MPGVSELAERLAAVVCDPGPTEIIFVSYCFLYEINFGFVLPILKIHNYKLCCDAATIKARELSRWFDRLSGAISSEPFAGDVLIQNQYRQRQEQAETTKQGYRDKRINVGDRCRRRAREKSCNCSAHVILQISRGALKGLSAIDETAFNQRAFNILFREPAGFSVRLLAIYLTQLYARSLRLV